MAAARWLSVLFVSISGEEQNKEALQDAEDEAQWDRTTQDKLSSSSSSSLNSLLPALSPVPSHSVQLGLLCSPLLLYLPLLFHPAPPFSPRMHVISLVFPTLGVFPSFHYRFFFLHACTPFKVHVLLHRFYFALFCCYHLLPSTLACICNTRARVYLKTILCCFPVYVRVCWWSVSCPCFVSCHIEETQQWWKV